jgi:hypothetical protein
VAIELVLLSCNISALEGCKVGIIDIPGALMHADAKDGGGHVRMARKMVELLVRVDLKLYRKYIRRGKGETSVVYGVEESAIQYTQGCADVLAASGKEMGGVGIYP